MAQVNWKDIEEYNGLYEISSNGVVRSCNRIIQRTYKSGKVVVQPLIGHNIKLSKNIKTGYLECNLCKDGLTHTKAVHRLVAETFIPNPDNKPQVNHKDGNKLNNNVDNLEWCTAAENVRHAIDNNLLQPKIEPLKTFWRNRGGS